MASTCYCEITFCNLFFIMKTMLIKKLHRTCGKGSVAVGGSGWQQRGTGGEDSPCALPDHIHLVLP